MKTKHKISTTSVRLSAHEKLCAERMSQFIKTIDELRGDVKQLHSDMNKGKGVIAFIIIVGGIIGAIVGLLKYFR
jgi:hypothetical protein